MAEDADATSRTPSDLRARLVGNALDHDQEDILFWRQASTQEHGQALYELLVFAQKVIDSTPERSCQPLTFPGFRRKPTRPPNPDP